LIPYNPVRCIRQTEEPEKYTAEAISHEVGHTLGLSHDGRITPSEGYYAGHGSGDTGWAPIMGVG
jgi:serralysin